MDVIPGGKSANAGAVAELTHLHQHLLEVRDRVRHAAGAAPHDLPSGWSGPAARAFLRARDDLYAELACVHNMLQSAAGLAETALLAVTHD